jgi:hypothetical protein
MSDFLIEKNQEYFLTFESTSILSNGQWLLIIEKHQSVHKKCYWSLPFIVVREIKLYSTSKLVIVLSLKKMSNVRLKKHYTQQQ